jgi:hypothetical protein
MELDQSRKNLFKIAEWVMAQTEPVAIATRIADLESQLATMIADRDLWQDAHDDDCPNKAALDEARKAATWKKITTENMPVGMDHLLYWMDRGCDTYAIGYFNRLSRTWFINGSQYDLESVPYTHFRPINPPSPEEPSK